jgi:hypothetical protein
VSIKHYYYYFDEKHQACIITGYVPAQPPAGVGNGHDHARALRLPLDGMKRRERARDWRLDPWHDLMCLASGEGNARIRVDQLSLHQCMLINTLSLSLQLK